MRTRLSVFVFLFSGVLSATAAWQIEPGGEGSTTGTICRHVELRATENERGEQAQLHLAVFDRSRATIEIVDQPNEPRRTLAQIVEGKTFLAGVNGGYFDPEDAPVGLLVRQGKVVSPLRKARLLSGILSVAGGKLRLQRLAGYSSKRVTEAVQCGPFLVEKGRVISGLNRDRKARRTFVALDRDKVAAIGFCSSVSLADLAQILVAIAPAQALHVESALNMDGGSSSAFWFRGERTEPFSIGEQKIVRDFIAVKPK